MKERLKNALDQYESEVLSYRQLTDDNDVALMAENLNVSKRSLIYTQCYSRCRQAASSERRGA